MSVITLFDGLSSELFDGSLMCGWRPRRTQSCHRAHFRQGRFAPLTRWPEDGPSLTAAARDGTGDVQVGTEGWFRSNKGIGRATRSLLRSVRTPSKDAQVCVKASRNAALSGLGRVTSGPLRKRATGWRLPGSASRAPYRFREVEVCPSVSEVLVLSAVTIQISFCSVFHRPSFFPLFELIWRR